MADAGPLDQPPTPPGRRGPRDLWDPGAQPERTYQAWTRTALAFTACSLLATRLVGGAAVLALVVSAVGAVGALVLVRVQKRRLHSAVIEPGPGPVLALTVMTALLGCACLALVLLGWTR